MDVNDSLSRRQWLGKITVPALAAGATMVGLEANASPDGHRKEDKLEGARIYNVRDYGAKGDGKRNFELGIWTTSNALIDGVLEHFNALWEGRRCDSCRRKEICPVPLEEPRL